MCWKIEQKNIYSLVTKANLLQKYLVAGLKKYMEIQKNILILHRFFSEPILSFVKKQDSFDLMVEMDINELLTHQVVVAVLNLIYDGKFSASQNQF